MINTSKLILISSAFLIFGCSSDNKQSENVGADSVDTKQTELSANDKIAGENFEEFNKKFHSDKNVQLSRIKFPLQGELITSSEQISEWNEKNWQFVDRAVVTDKWTDKDLKHKLTKTNDEVYEKIWIENAGFAIERKFQLINNNWYLTLYNETSI